MLEFNKTHLYKAGLSTRDANRLLSHLKVKTGYVKKEAIVLQESTGRYYPAQLIHIDIYKALEVCKMNFITELEIVREDLEDYPEGVPDTSDVWWDEYVEKPVKKVKNPRRKLSKKRQNAFIKKFKTVWE